MADGKDLAPLTPAIIKALNDKMYEKRKNGGACGGRAAGWLSHPHTAPTMRWWWVCALAAGLRRPLAGRGRWSEVQRRGAAALRWHGSRP